MSGKISGIVWRSELPQNQKFVLLAYAEHAGDDGCKSFPSVATVAKLTGYSGRQVKRIKKELIQASLLDQTGLRPNGTPVYRVVIENLTPLDFSDGSTDSEADTDSAENINPDGYTVSDCHGDELSRGDIWAGGGDIICHGGGDKIVSPEPSFNRQLNPHESTTTTTAHARTHEDWFEELTEDYQEPTRTDDLRIGNEPQPTVVIDPALGKIKTACELHGLWLNPTLSAKIDDIYDEITPPDSETKLEWFEYAVSEAATTDSRPKWPLIETIMRAVQDSGGLAIHKANRAEQKQNGGKNNGNSTDDSGGNSGGKRQAKKPAGVRSPGWKYEPDRSYLDEYIASPAIGD